ncbi:MAG: hypothetical protein J6Q30_03115, partial [Oscillospiraceae bacterium]|nr:hypothetical protein [Oscillospiraceae bacterium]
AVGEVLTSSVKNRLKAPVFATFPKGEGLGGCAAEERINPFPTPRQTEIGKAKDTRYSKFAPS